MDFYYITWTVLSYVLISFLKSYPPRSKLLSTKYDLYDEYIHSLIF